MRNTAVILLFFFLSSNSFATTENEIRYGELISFVYSHSIIFNYSSEAISLRLLKERSYYACRRFTDCDKYKYTILTNSTYSGYNEVFITHLPEIGDWSIQNHIAQQTRNNNKYFYLTCDEYNGKKSEFIFDHELGIFHSNDMDMKKGISYRKMISVVAKRSPIENLDYVRAAMRTIFVNTFPETKVSINIVSDEDTSTFQRFRNLSDDVILQISRIKHKSIETSDVRTFIIPSVYFVTVRNVTEIKKPETGLVAIKCEIIVQKLLTKEGEWEYRRLEILEGPASYEITINDLGPVPRSEWEPGWPDPATTPLWQEPESACAQCE